VGGPGVHDQFASVALGGDGECPEPVHVPGAVGVEHCFSVCVCLLADFDDAVEDLGFAEVLPFPSAGHPGSFGDHRDWFVVFGGFEEFLGHVVAGSVGSQVAGVDDASFRGVDYVAVGGGYGVVYVDGLDLQGVEAYLISCSEGSVVVVPVVGVAAGLFHGLHEEFGACAGVYGDFGVDELYVGDVVGVGVAYEDSVVGGFLVFEFGVGEHFLCVEAGESGEEVELEVVFEAVGSPGLEPASVIVLSHGE